MDCSIMKTASRVLLHALTHVVNLSIKEKVFLEQWKFMWFILTTRRAAGRTLTTTGQSVIWWR